MNRPSASCDILRQYMLGAEVTEERVAELMCNNHHVVSQLFLDRRKITAYMAVRLEHATGILAEKWCSLQNVVELYEEREKLVDSIQVE